MKWLFLRKWLFLFVIFQLCKAAICQWEGRELSCCNLSISIMMHNLKHRAILGALWWLARVRAAYEPSESEYKTNDGNGCNYIYGRILIWLTCPSLFYLSPCLAYLLLSLTHFERQPPDLPPPSTSISHFSLSLSLFYHLCLRRQVRREGSKSSQFC